MITDDDIASLIKQIRARTKAKVELVLFSAGAEQTIVLRWITVPEKHRRKRRGSWAMQMLCDFADSHNVEIELSVDASFGTAEHVLRAFYRSFGFERDTQREYVVLPGKHSCDPKICMVRPPFAEDTALIS